MRYQKGGLEMDVAIFICVFISLMIVDIILMLIREFFDSSNKKQIQHLKERLWTYENAYKEISNQFYRQKEAYNVLLYKYEVLLKREKRSRMTADVVDAIKYAMKRSHPDNGGKEEDFIKFKKIFDDLIEK